MRQSFLPAVGLALVAVTCGRGYEDENRSIVSELPALEDVVLLNEDHYSYCSEHTCQFGDDRSGARLTYSVDTDRYTQDSLADAYRLGLSGWEATIEQGCLNADPSFCDETVFASFVRGEAQISLNLDNWHVARFDLHVDAEGAG